jgi:hypothetical protein
MRHALNSLLAIAMFASIVGCTDPGPGPNTIEKSTTAATPTWAMSSWTGSFEGLAETGLCALDAVNGAPAVEGAFRVRNGQPITLEGWASTATLTTPPSIRLILDGALSDNASDVQLSGPTNIARDDVAKAYSAVALANAGFKAELAALSASAGEYTVVIEHTESGASVICRTNLRLIVE